MKYREIIEGIPMSQRMLSVSPKKEYTIGFEFEMAVDDVENIDSDDIDYDGGTEDAWEAFSNYWYSGGSTFDFTDWFDRYISYDIDFKRFVEENEIEPKYGYVETVKTIVDIENKNKKKNTQKRLEYYNNMAVFDLEDYINQYTNDPEKFLNNREQVKNFIIFVYQTVQNNEPRSESGWNKIFQQMDDERLRKNLNAAIEILKTHGIIYAPIDPEDVELGEYIWKNSDQTEIVNIREDLYALEDMLEYFDTDIEELRDLTSSSWEYEESEQFSSAFNDWYARNSQSGKIGYVQDILRSNRNFVDWLAVSEAQLEVDVEVITSVMPLTNGIQKFRKMLKIIRDDPKLSTNTHTGLHINIGTFDDWESIDWFKFLIVYHPQLALEQFGRTLNTYARDRMAEIIKNLELGKAADPNQLKLINKIVIDGSQKTSSVNLSKLKTKKHIEIRAPGGADYEMKEDVAVNQIQRAIRALEIARDPNMYRNEYLKKLVKIFGKSEGKSQSERFFHNFGIRYLQKAPLVTVQDLLGSNIDFAKFDSQYTLGVHRELVNHLKKYEYPNNVKGVLDQYVEKIPNLKNYKFFRLLLQSFNSVTEVQLGSNIDFAKQGIVEGQLDALVNSDQAERNAYKKFVADQAGGNWELGAKLYADLKKRPLTDIFGDDARIKQFMRTKFVFNKFSDKDWENYWLLSQHADRYINFQKQALINIEKYLGQDNDYYRYLADRISCAVSGQQKYGTQSICGEKGETFN